MDEFKGEEKNLKKKKVVCFEKTVFQTKANYSRESDRKKDPLFM